MSSSLFTERLILRPWPSEDVAAAASGRRRPGWAADFPADGDRVIAGLLAADPAAARGQRQIVERETGLVIGSIGLFWPAADGAVEFGYGVVPSRRGRGHATEAARAVVAFALAEPDVRTVRAGVEPSNAASVRVLEKAGLRRVGGTGGTDRYSTA
ncbi:GNAT family N-acetyltransferase [Actinomadura algeriensis]|uniref:RimJ/RimL family protein N-acetyltransferase n=1 Tax=Actinomadura algeriensis TaxID=1679523 RepID=A0ABR9JQ66_9ACTN|nr:GNAT family N-acetyltransferase [Actinomadura algeriensis]MBE1532720.1 RimJ/RimL family protein N-acetyltransferase [Actinomadura algeriensis]